MARWLWAGGSAAVFMAMGLAMPGILALAEMRSPTGFALALLIGAGILGAAGITAVVAGIWQGGRPAMPSGVRAAAAANLGLLTLCALELSDRLVRQEGRVLYWTTFLFPPAFVTFYGLVSARRWAWWVCRVVTLVATLWFLAWAPLIPFADVRGEDGPEPWYGRVFMVSVYVVCAGISADVFWSLGHPTARSYFGFLLPGGRAVAGAAEGSPPNQGLHHTDRA